MVRLVLVAVGIVVLGVLWRLGSTLVPVSGAFQSLEPHLVEECTPVSISPGTEDLVIDHQTGHVFVSATDRRRELTDNPGDGVYVFDLASQSEVTKVWPTDDRDYNPHGVSLWHGEGSTRLFVINHPTGEVDAVDIFEVGEGGSLTQVESISFEEMYTANDVLAVGPNQFYATNSKGYTSGILAPLENPLALPATSIAYFDGTSGRFAKKGLIFANGINQAPDGRTLFVAESMKRRVTLFDRDVESGELTRKGRWKLNTMTDNIDVDADGTVWVGGHPELFKLLAHQGDPSIPAPSHVVRIDPNDPEPEDVFIALNGEINASSVGAVHDGKLVVGSVFDGHVMVCPLGE